MIDSLKSLGIEKGKPFRPDDATRALLTSAVQQAGTWRTFHAFMVPTGGVGFRYEIARKERHSHGAGRRIRPVQRRRLRPGRQRLGAPLTEIH
jgi:hypothetical protein